MVTLLLWSPLVSADAGIDEIIPTWQQTTEATEDYQVAPNGFMNDQDIFADTTPKIEDKGEGEIGLSSTGTQ